MTGWGESECGTLVLRMLGVAGLLCGASHYTLDVDVSVL